MPNFLFLCKKKKQLNFGYSGFFIFVCRLSAIWKIIKKTAYVAVLLGTCYSGVFVSE